MAAVSWIDSVRGATDAAQSRELCDAGIKLICKANEGADLNVLLETMRDPSVVDDLATLVLRADRENKSDMVSEVTLLATLAYGAPRVCHILESRGMVEIVSDRLSTFLQAQRDAQTAEARVGHQKVFEVALTLLGIISEVAQDQHNWDVIVRGALLDDDDDGTIGPEACFLLGNIARVSRSEALEDAVEPVVATLQNIEKAVRSRTALDAECYAAWMAVRAVELMTHNDPNVALTFIRADAQEVLARLAQSDLRRDVYFVASLGRAVQHLVVTSRKYNDADLRRAMFETLHMHRDTANVYCVQGCLAALSVLASGPELTAAETRALLDASKRHASDVCVTGLSLRALCRGLPSRREQDSAVAAFASDALERYGAKSVAVAWYGLKLAKPERARHFAEKLRGVHADALVERAIKEALGEWSVLDSLRAWFT